MQKFFHQETEVKNARAIREPSESSFDNKQSIPDFIMQDQSSSKQKSAQTSMFVSQNILIPTPTLSQRNKYSSKDLAAQFIKAELPTQLVHGNQVRSKNSGIIP